MLLLTNLFSIKDSGGNSLINIDSNTYIARVSNNSDYNGSHQHVYIDSDNKLHTSTFNNFIS
jgi:hypothetical protein